MTTGSVLYLLMCIGAFAALAIVLAYNTWQQTRMGGDFGTAPQARQPSHAEAHTEAHA